jgi:hypothetical protein
VGCRRDLAGRVMDEEELNEISETFASNVWGEGLGGPEEIAENFLESLIGFKQRLREQRSRHPRFPEDVQINYINLMDTAGENRNVPAERFTSSGDYIQEEHPPGVNQGKRRGITKPAVCPRKRRRK